VSGLDPVLAIGKCIGSATARGRGTIDDPAGDAAVDVAEELGSEGGGGMPMGIPVVLMLVINCIFMFAAVG
jgi:hypothetical protein